MHQHRPGFWSFNFYLFKTPSWDRESRARNQQEWGHLLECKECGMPLTLSKKDRDRYDITCFVASCVLTFCFLLPVCLIPVLRDLMVNSTWIMCAFLLPTITIFAYLVSYVFFKRIHFEIKSSAEDDAVLRETEAICKDETIENEQPPKDFGPKEAGKWALKYILYCTVVCLLRVSIYIFDFDGVAFCLENIGSIVAAVAIVILTFGAFFICKKYDAAIKEKRWLTILFRAIFIILGFAYIWFSVNLAYASKLFWLDSLNR
ncbi:MAG: hypothetical protein IJC85_04225 [Oscillospiraceae bacterium]|nr:hypothetical protein [Oscillospiraceae bacterium]